MIAVVVMMAIRWVGLLIINAMLIARYGIAAMKLKKEETSHDK